ncbi:MAG TPA: formylglycine-generating enzyme family protein, partial [Ideonella sp.]|uniref:formylglycine-generating enzyme family protein n=1 Tax=Ideonella sp. TaxID=1929293 RepID=UPI002E357F12
DLAWLPRRRAQVRPSDDEPLRTSTPTEEPVPGFVRITTRGKTSPTEPPLPATDIFLGRTLVTVQQYGAFVDDGGYADDSLWDGDGLAWRMGAFDALAATTLGGAAMAPRAVALRHLPWRWAEQRTAPTHPVVGVSWYEARAYAAWLGLQLRPDLVNAGLSHHRVRLPTELEWERAVRAKSLQQADARDFPWDEEARSVIGPVGLANVDVARLGHSSAVGLFPPNPLGLFDLAGNVWEWMDNFLLPADAAGAARRIESAAPIRYLGGQISAQPGMALRGGSWQSSLDDARCGVRVSHMPWEHDDTIGFRVALVPPQATPPA